MFIGWGTTTFRKIAWQNVELRAVALIGATSFTQMISPQYHISPIALLPIINLGNNTIKSHIVLM